MSMHKEEVPELVRQLPHEVDVEEVIYRLYLREKLAAAEAPGEGISRCAYLYKEG